MVTAILIEVKVSVVSNRYICITPRMGHVGGSLYIMVSSASEIAVQYIRRHSEPGSELGSEP